MIIWLNGTFGAGKTTAAAELTRQLPRSRVFDSETVGHMLRHVITEPVRNFQDWPPWRSLVVHAAAQLQRYLGETLIIPQTVLDQRYAREIFDGLTEHGVEFRHFLLHAEDTELRRRITTGTTEAETLQWRLDHLHAYQAALPWLSTSAVVIDTTTLPPKEIAYKIINQL